MQKVKNGLLNTVYPWVSGVVLVILSCLLNWDVCMRGFGEVLESIIQFSGLVIGFYTAMYGIVIVVGNKLIEEFRNQNVEKIFRKNLTHSLSIAFIAYTLSVIMQVLRYNNSIAFEIKSFAPQWNEIGFVLWIFVVGVFVGMSYRSIRLLLKMLFYKSNNSNKLELTTAGENSAEKKERLSELTRNDF